MPVLLPVNCLFWYIYIRVVLCTTDYETNSVNFFEFICYSCPMDGCKADLPHYIIRSLLKDEEFERWERLLAEVNWRLNLMPYCVLCCFLRNISNECNVN